MPTSQNIPLRVCGILLHCALILTLAASGRSATPTPLSATLASTTVPPGATVQLQIMLNSAETLVSGSAIITLDPTIFDNISFADVYSATGDQVGSANIQGRTVDIEFNSQTGGAGRLPGLPVLSVTVPVLATALPGAASTPTFQPGTRAWIDTNGQHYSVTLSSGAITIGGQLSLSSIQPAGTAVTINGTGFNNGTTVQIEGIALTATQLVGAQQIKVTLAQTIDLTGHQITIQNPSGPTVSAFYTLHGDFSQRPLSGPLATIQPIFPQQLYPASYLGSFLFDNTLNGVALQNPTQSAVGVSIQSISIFGTGGTDRQTAVQLPPGGSYLQTSTALGGQAGDRAELYAIPNLPIRMAVVGPSNYFSAVTAIPIPPTYLTVVKNGTSTFADSSDPLNWNINPSGPQPSPVVLAVTNDLPVQFVVSLSSGPWFTVSPQQGTACVTPILNQTTCSSPSLVTVSVNPTGLSPGSYTGTLTIVPQALNPSPTVIPLSLNVYQSPTILIDQTSVVLAAQNASQAPYSNPVHLTSSADPLSFTTTVSTQSGQNWLSVTPSQGQTPATLNVAFTPSALTASNRDAGTVTITGPNNSLTVNVSAAILNSSGYPPLVTIPTALNFSAQLGQPAPVPQTLNVSPTFGAINLSAQTATGGNWLTAAIGNQGGLYGLITANPAGLAAGTYQGTVTVAATLSAGPVQVPVTLYVYATPPAVTVSPSSLPFQAVHGSISMVQTVQVSTGPIPLPVGISVSTADGGNWLGASIAGSGLSTQSNTPAAISVSTTAVTQAVGTYSGIVTITAPTGSSNSSQIPISFTVLSAPLPPPPTGTVPLATAILNGASQSPVTLAPGEIIAIFGQNLGPAIPAGLILAANKVATSNNGVQVLFGNFSAPLLYVSATQINAIVPYEVTGPSTSVTLQYNGADIPAGTYAVSPSAPAVFTLNATGRGPAAVLNQDASINSPANPAARGSTVQVYATGAGATLPASTTGLVTTGANTQPALPVSVTIGGVSAAVTYAAEAPGEVSGVMQVNATIPQSLTPGSSIPIVLTIGSAQSQTGAVIAIK